jgi:hypothetical protein
MIGSIFNAQMVSREALNIVMIGYNYLRTLFVSYFVVNILNFFTITLMYNYLNIRTQPSFSHSFLYKLSQIMYLQNSLIGTFSNFFPNLNTT